ncbi:metallophosphoesterase family protein [Treponema primitia]|uniref:metallophosphoesterase family protein n=1 Tax=Treponema primitia TaxID=88058 RepID=UPI0002E159C2|nr:metallophosphoesterase [Treponema primitia]
MVIKSLRSRILLLAALVPLLFLPLACNVDLVGLIASGELDVRLESSNVFTFLTDSDRNHSLGGEYSFIVLSDTHIEDGNAHGLEGLKDAIKPDDKFVVITGDITQNGRRRDIEKFIEIARTLGIPCYPVVGNHDIYFNNWPIWRDFIGSTRYRIDHDTTSLFVLDSANASFGSAQLDWLRDELRSAKSHVFVFTHTNLFVETPVDIQQIADTRERARILSILRDRADAMFMGHVHQRIIRKAGGVEYITIEDFRENSTYCRVHVSDRGISWEFEKL